MTKWCCELPFLIVATLAVLYGALGLFVGFNRGPHERDEVPSDIGLGAVMVAIGVVSLGVWAILRFAVD